MNERIRELAEQAGLLHKQIGPCVETRHMKKKEQDLEKFAELIAREILSYAQDGDLDFMKFMIKKNFGIEE
jgi:hypothetical protein